jgi:hypothetical protein
MSRTIFHDIASDPFGAIKKSPKIFTDKSFRHSVGRRLNQSYFTKLGRDDYNQSGIDIFDEDWDNFIILDSCRHDYFEDAKKSHKLPGELTTKISRGSQTPEWLKANFEGKTLHDTVYVSASIVPYHIGVEEFDDGTPFQKKYAFDLDIHELVNLWEDPPKEAKRVYDDSRIADYVIPADATADAALKVHEEYPNKRLIVHIVPPHLPYLGPTGEEIHQKSARPWRETFGGECTISLNMLEQAYQENVDHAVAATKTLLNEFRGKSVVTADHGEYLFDRSYPVPITEYLHPAKIYTEELVEVPWLVVDSDERKTIESEEPKMDQIETDVDSREQLEALGYL